MQLEDRNRLVGLLDRCAGGERAALEALYRETSAKLFGLALRVLKDADSAQDVLQEGFIKIWRQSTTYDPARGAPMAWLAGIVHHAAIDHLRRESRRHAIPLEEPAAIASLQTAPASAELGALQRCLDALEPRQRDCLLNAYFQGYTHQELSRLTAPPVGTVKSWIRRGLASLKRCLEP